MKQRTWIAFFLSLCLICLAGCAPKAKDDAAKTGEELDEMEVLFGSMEEEPTPSPTPLEALYYDYSDYKNVLRDTEYEYEEYMGGDYLEYGLCDLDGDGILEMIVKEGTSEADFLWRVYTIGETGAKDVGSFGGGHSLLYTDAEPGVLCVYGQMGHEEIVRVTYDGQYISLSTLISQDLADGEEYSKPGSPVATYPIGDPSFIPYTMTENSSLLDCRELSFMRFSFWPAP